MVASMHADFRSTTIGRRAVCSCPRAPETRRRRDEALPSSLTAPPRSTPSARAAARPCVPHASCALRPRAFDTAPRSARRRSSASAGRHVLRRLERRHVACARPTSASAYLPSSDSTRARFWRMPVVRAAAARRQGEAPVLGLRQLDARARRTGPCWRARRAGSGLMFSAA